MSDTLFGYAGGKTRLKPSVLEALSQFDKCQYREPFFGGGAIGLHLMKWRWGRDIWVNDKDPGIHAVWQSVAKFPEKLKEMVMKFKPSVEWFKLLRTFLLSNPIPKTTADMIKIGFAKLAIHKISFSGLGVMAGSVSERVISDHRWSPVAICKKIDTLHEYFNREIVTITRVDYADLITDESVQALLYLDPPYVAKGPECYQHSFTYSDHVRLSELLKQTRHQWVMSYDDCYLIRNLYSAWTTITTLEAPYSLSRTTKRELLICSKV